MHGIAPPGSRPPGRPRSFQGRVPCTCPNDYGRAMTRRNHSGPADDVDRWASQLTPAQLMCRDLGHPWAPGRVYVEGRGRRREYVQVLVCPRCEAERVRTLDHEGRPGANSYRYADGYQAPAGAGFLSADGRADLRLRAVLGLVDEAAPMPDELASRRARKAS